MRRNRDVHLRRRRGDKPEEACEIQLRRETSEARGCFLETETGDLAAASVVIVFLDDANLGKVCVARRTVRGSEPVSRARSFTRARTSRSGRPNSEVRAAPSHRRSSRTTTRTTRRPRRKSRMGHGEIGYSRRPPTHLLGPEIRPESDSNRTTLARGMPTELPLSPRERHNPDSHLSPHRNHTRTRLANLNQD